tara:strand:- start:510 stop:773 length:264 start_codon:yes stop_codon:yes gene_type:complete
MSGSPLELDEQEDAPVIVTRPIYYADEEPDGGSVRNDLQIYAMMFGAQEVTLTLNFGAGGTQSFSAIHPELIEQLQTNDDPEIPEAA